MAFIAQDEVQKAGFKFWKDLSLAVIRSQLICYFAYVKHSLNDLEVEEIWFQWLFF
jgi:hypothetical protein